MPILFPFTLEAKQSHPEILNFPLRVEKYSPPRFFSPVQSRTRESRFSDERRKSRTRDERCARVEPESSFFSSIIFVRTLLLHHVHAR